mgnify:FL=1
MFNSEVKDCAMQIENEYKNAERAFHEKGPPYVQWAAAMAVGLQTGVPWVMCKQDDAPDPVVTISTSLFGQWNMNSSSLNKHQRKSCLIPSQNSQANQM